MRLLQAVQFSFHTFNFQCTSTLKHMLEAKCSCLGYLIDKAIFLQDREKSIF